MSCIYPSYSVLISGAYVLKDQVQSFLSVQCAKVMLIASLIFEVGFGIIRYVTHYCLKQRQITPTKNYLKEASSDVQLLVLSYLNPKDRKSFMRVDRNNAHHVRLLIARGKQFAIDYLKTLSDTLDPIRYQADLKYLYERTSSIVNRSFLTSEERQVQLNTHIFSIFRWQVELLNVSDLPNNKFLMLCLVKIEGEVLRLANIVLRGDRDVVLAAVKQDGRGLRQASIELRGDKKIVLIAVKQYGWLISYISVELRDDKEVVLVAVKQCGWALYSASLRLRGDKEVVIAAVQQDKAALQYASIELQNDPDIRRICGF